MKPKVAFFGMTSCKGCYFQFLILGERLKSLFEKIETSSFWMLKEINNGKDYDVVFLDGAVANDDNVREVKDIRKRAKYLIAFGTCACLGGIPQIRNSVKGYHEKVYGKPIKRMPSKNVIPVDELVKVDYKMTGCPINEEEALRVVSDLLIGKAPGEPDYPVCVECKKKKIRCLWKDGIPCMGPVTRGGCDAPCPESRTGCDGCRGPLPDANWAKEAELLAGHGISKEQIKIMFSKYSKNNGKGKVS